MTTEMIADAVAAEVASVGGGPTARQIQAGYQFSLADIARFENALYGPRLDPRTTVASQPVVQPSTEVTRSSLYNVQAFSSMVDPLNRINAEAQKLALDAAKMSEGGELTPSELMMITVRSHELLFHCELTSNVASRASDGVQELFREQA